MKIILLLIFNISLFAQPDWLNNPNIDGYISGIGYSNDKNPVLRRRIATVSARANIAETIKVEIKSYFKIKKKINLKSYSKETEQIMEQKASAVLVNSTVKDTYQDSNGVFYILMVVKRSFLKE